MGDSAVQQLLSVQDLVVRFPIQRGILRRRVGWIPAVNGVTLSIREGETLGLVGESGSGKSTLARAIIQLIRPSSGTVYFEGRELTSMDPKDLRLTRRRMQMVFQDPYGSLDPRWDVGSIIAEPLAINRIGSKSERRQRVAGLLELVGLDPRYVGRYPHEFSGGQRQRVAIARALALNPRFLICDEPTSALDVSIRAQIILLLKDLQQAMGLTYLFIAHDMALLREISDRVAVMYLGGVVEVASREHLYAEPRHPYTAALLSAVSLPSPRVERQRRRVILRGEIPSPASPPSGCRFRTRCPFARDRCRDEVPILRPVEGATVACHFAEELQPELATWGLQTAATAASSATPAPRLSSPRDVATHGC